MQVKIKLLACWGYLQAFDIVADFIGILSLTATIPKTEPPRKWKTPHINIL